MPQQENEGAERTSVDIEELKESLRIAEKRSSRSPYGDNVDRVHQTRAELEMVRDWAREMEKCGHSVSEIRPNLDESGNHDDPPDVLAEVGGELVGIEVTNLMKHLKGYELFTLNSHGIATLRSKQRQNGTFDHHWRGAEVDPDATARREREIEANPHRHPPWSEWTLEQFQTELAKIVKTKDDKALAKKAKRMLKHGENALDSRLHASFLLIFTPELYLGQRRLAEYLEQTAVRRPENLDRVFVMGYEPRDGHPVFEVRLIR